MIAAVDSDPYPVAVRGFWHYMGAAAVVLFGAVQLSIGVGVLRQTVERATLWLRGDRTRGVITSVTAETGELRRIALADTVPSRARIGAPITVVYRPDDPERVDALGIANGLGSLIAFPILVVVGAAAIVLPVAYPLGLDGVLSWAQQVVGDTSGRLEDALGAPLGRLRRVLVEWLG
ncbi:hypothetical protein [Nocardia jiangsuensis]|uniref:DUF3592 domain-containing protein n=1 Tax=Nocardia jiangsuensis TaxID=1691563 RepID=A0ABV8DSX4_9NOCA